ncbi:MAG: single-stranded DNA-binding protein [Treponema sp.]|nr:single-stranded DNA-binding protein [Treponema sp.]
MNVIILHGKVTKAAEMRLVYIEKEPVPVAVFTVVDIGLPYQRGEPLFIQVNYRKEAASLIFKYLTENKEVLIHGILRQKFIREESSGTKQIRYFILADMVELLPQFPKTERKDIPNKEEEHEG